MASHSPQSPLYVFFSYRTSLQLWESVGLITRELKPFIRISKYSSRPIIFVTYGSYQTERKVLSRYLPNNIDIKVLSLDGMENLPMHFRYVFLLFILLSNVSSNSTSFTLQTSSLLLALPVSFLKRTKLISRSGFDHIEFLSRLRPCSLTILLYYVLEFLSYVKSSYLIFATHEDKMRYLNRHYLFHQFIPSFIKPSISTLSNWVDTDLFCPSAIKSDVYTSRTKLNLISIGRLSKQKGYISFLRNIPMDLLPHFSITIIGSGDQSHQLLQLASSRKIDLHLLPRVANHELPMYLNQADVYFQASIFEGNPKTLLEALSCGCLVLCRSSNGIKEIITHDYNGFLYSGNESLKDALYRLYNLFSTNDESLIGIRSNARNHILSHNSLDSYLPALKEILFH